MIGLTERLLSTGLGALILTGTVGCTAEEASLKKTKPVGVSTPTATPNPPRELSRPDQVSLKFDMSHVFGGINFKNWWTGGEVLLRNPALKHWTDYCDFTPSLGRVTVVFRERLLTGKPFETNFGVDWTSIEVGLGSVRETAVMPGSVNLVVNKSFVWGICTAKEVAEWRRKGGRNLAERETILSSVETRVAERFASTADGDEVPLAIQVIP